MKFIFCKIISFFYKLVCKLVYLFIPILSKVLVFFRLQSRIANQFIKLRSEIHLNIDYFDFVSKVLGDNKISALDVGAQGGFNGNIFSKKYNIFFNPILVEPIKEEVKKLSLTDQIIIEKGLWSKKCKKKIYIMEKRSGSSSMYEPNTDVFDLYDIKEKNYDLFIESTSLVNPSESLTAI